MQSEIWGPGSKSSTSSESATDDCNDPITRFQLPFMTYSSLTPREDTVQGRVCQSKALGSGDHMHCTKKSATHDLASVKVQGARGPAYLKLRCPKGDETRNSGPCSHRPLGKAVAWLGWTENSQGTCWEGEIKVQVLSEGGRITSGF